MKASVQELQSLGLLKFNTNADINIIDVSLRSNGESRKKKERLGSTTPA